MRTWKTFTPEEVTNFRAHPYVKSATTKMIRFTVEFKEEFWRMHSEEGKSSRTIMEALGFDVEMLGENRVYGILTHIRDQAKSGEGFRDVRKEAYNAERYDLSALPPSKALLRMMMFVTSLRNGWITITTNVINGGW